MSHGNIRAIDPSCESYHRGHQVHWIQANKSVEDEQSAIEVSIVVHDYGRVDIEGDNLNLTAWNHDPQRLQSAVDYWGRAVWKPRYHVLSLPGLFGYVFNLAALDDWTPCMRDVLRHAPIATEKPLGRALREPRENHGFTAPLHSLDVVEGQTERH
jgi:hypothetical protein